jgi:diguanylate cyclase (GGDEF)-like protein
VRPRVCVGALLQDQMRLFRGEMAGREHGRAAGDSGASEFWQRRGKPSMFHSRLHPDAWHDTTFDPEFFMPEPDLGFGVASRRSAHTHEASHKFSSCRAIEKLSLALLQQISAPAMALAAAHAIRQTLDLRGALVWELDSRQKALNLTACAGISAAHSSALESVALDSLPSAAVLAVNRRSGLFLPDIECSSLTKALEGKLAEGECGGLYAVPLIAEGEVIGAVEFIGRFDDDRFSHHKDLMDRMALLAAVGLRRARIVDELERQAASDALTGLPNRRTVNEFLASRLAESRRTGKTLGLVLIDVDHFRQFNEEAGHDAGDEVLKEVSEVLRRSIRAYDLAGRYGGEEFLVILPGADMKDSMQTADRIRERIASLSPRYGCRVTASLGVSLYPESAEESEALLKLADRALYRAKRLGRNRVCPTTWQDQSDGCDLSDLVLSLAKQDKQAEAAEALHFASDQIDMIKVKMGLRLGHLDLVRAALALLALIHSDGLTARLADEAESGDLRAVQALIDQVSRGGRSSRASVALAEVLKGLNDGRFGPITGGWSSHEAPAA